MAGSGRRHVCVQYRWPGALLVLWPPHRCGSDGTAGEQSGARLQLLQRHRWPLVLPFQVAPDQQCPEPCGYSLRQVPRPEPPTPPALRTRLHA
ncbi:hypothetical protein HaLaN_21458 [Haematococcus lacustris]|uniref:Uncharacterized protein n=1 Tax=Haematococcus lacustris TaxID=44745 RepID=A0A699ZYK9_HAELA|nr:hypothetical protein HaLaN_21458 [Haematococcus lacustris]